MKRLRIAVLASGGGTTFQNLVERSRDGRLGADVALLVASRPDCGAVERARRLGVPHRVVSWKNPADADRAVREALSASAIDLVCLGGFLKLWTIAPPWVGRVMNIHPALLPKFGGKGMFGRRVHEAVLASGAKESGCTVHFATNDYDAGPIILQKRVPVIAGDTAESLAARVFAAECEAYPEAIGLFAEGRLSMDGPHVRVRSSP